MESTLSMPRVSGTDADVFLHYSILRSFCILISSSKARVLLMKQSLLILLGLAAIALAGCPGSGIGFPPTKYTEYAYVANSNSSNVSAYGVTFGTGALTQVTGSPFTAGFGPHGVALYQDSLGIGLAFVTNENSNTVSAYAVNAATGGLIQAGSFAAGTSPYGVAIDPTYNCLYVTNFASSNVSDYSINTATGALTTVGTFAAGTAPYGAAVDSGKFLYVTNFGSNTVSAYNLNNFPSASPCLLGQLTGSPFASGNSPSGAAVTRDGNFLYVTNEGDNNVSAYSINSTTGALTPVSGSPFKAGTSPIGVAVQPVFLNVHLYVTNSGSNTVSTYAIGGNGALTAVGTPAPSGNSPVGVAVDPLGAFLYVTNAGDNTVSAYSINSTSGALTSAGSPFAAGANPYAVALLYTLTIIPPTPTPSPSPSPSPSPTPPSLAAGTMFVLSGGASSGIWSIYIWPPGSSGGAGSLINSINFASSVAPTGIAVDANGRVYVPSSTAGFTSVFSFVYGASGNATPSSNLSTDTSVWAPALDSFGALDLTDYKNNAVDFFASGATGNAVPGIQIQGNLTQLSTPYEVGRDGTGLIYVVNNCGGGIGSVCGAGSVTVYPASSSGNQAPISVLTITAGMAAPVGIAVASDGRVYVAQSTTNTITVYAPGSTSVQTTLFGSTLLFKIIQGSQIAVDASKNLYVAAGNSNDVYEFAPVTGSTPPPPGSYINHLTCTCLNGAFGIAVVP